MLALITATRNSMATLPTAVASLGEVDREVKSIFVDGGSDDGTLAYLQSFASSTRNAVLLSQDGSGLYEALNQGVLSALSDRAVSHIGVLHSDDRLMPAAFSEYLSYIDGDSADVYYSNIQYHNTSDEIVRVWRSGKASVLKLNTGWMPPHTSMIVRKSVYEKLGLYDTSYGTSADYEWIVRVLRDRIGSVDYFPKCTLSMLVGGASNANLASRLRANAMDGKVWESQSATQSIIIRILKPARKVGQFLARMGDR